MPLSQDRDGPCYIIVSWFFPATKGRILWPIEYHQAHGQGPLCSALLGWPSTRPRQRRTARQRYQHTGRPIDRVPGGCSPWYAGLCFIARYGPDRSLPPKWKRGGGIVLEAFSEIFFRRIFEATGEIPQQVKLTLRKLRIPWSRFLNVPHSHINTPKSGSYLKVTTNQVFIKMMKATLDSNVEPINPRWWMPRFRHSSLMTNGKPISIWFRFPSNWGVRTNWRYPNDFALFENYQGAKICTLIKTQFTGHSALFQFYGPYKARRDVLLHKRRIPHQHTEQAFCKPHRGQ